MANSRINVFLPPISSFPGLHHPGGYAQVLPKAHAQKSSPKPRPDAAGGVSEVLEVREQHYLYVIDSQGHLLEHMRYSGDDHRAALRESLAPDTIQRPVDTKAVLNSHFKPNVSREPACSLALGSEELQSS